MSLLLRRPDAATTGLRFEFTLSSCRAECYRITMSLRRRERFVVRPDLTLAAAVLVFALVVGVAILIPNRPVAVERRWDEWMRDIETPALTDVALFFNAIGKGVWRDLAIAAISIVLLFSRRVTALVAFLAAELLTPLLVDVTKSLVGRPRPLDPLVGFGGSTFPSGHAAYTGATLTALVLLFTQAGRRRWYVTALAVLVIAVMAWTRTYLHVHWAADVVTGALLGIAVALACFAGLQLLAPSGRSRQTIGV
jgi:membrane-associated phospholipid phosphatase